MNKVETVFQAEDIRCNSFAISRRCSNMSTPSNSRASDRAFLPPAASVSFRNLMVTSADSNLRKYLSAKFSSVSIFDRTLSSFSSTVSGSGGWVRAEPPSSNLLQSSHRSLEVIATTLWQPLHGTALCGTHAHCTLWQVKH